MELFCDLWHTVQIDRRKYCFLGVNTIPIGQWVHKIWPNDNFKRKFYTYLHG